MPASQWTNTFPPDCFTLSRRTKKTSMNFLYSFHATREVGFVSLHYLQTQVCAHSQFCTQTHLRGPCESRKNVRPPPPAPQPVITLYPSIQPMMSSHNLVIELVFQGKFQEHGKSDHLYMSSRPTRGHLPPFVSPMNESRGSNLESGMTQETGYGRKKQATLGALMVVLEWRVLTG